VTNPHIELAVRPFLYAPEVWTTMEDARDLINDQFLTGNAFVVPVADREPDSLVTHRRVPPAVVLL